MLLNLIKYQRATTYWQNLLICQRSLWIKVTTAYYGRKKVEIEILKNPKAFIDYSQRIYDVYENLEDYNPAKKRRVLIEFDDMIADMESNKKLSSIVTELFLKGRKLNISLVFISQSYSKVPTLECLIEGA